jgi:hypothetical protein
MAVEIESPSGRETECPNEASSDLQVCVAGGNRGYGVSDHHELLDRIRQFALNIAAGGDHFCRELGDHGLFEPVSVRDCLSRDFPNHLARLCCRAVSEHC